MNKLLRKQLSNQRGVTLIELLAVIVIIGIIAAVAVPAVLGQIDDSKKGADLATAFTIKDAAERYLVEFPDTDGALAIATLISEGYLKETPESQVDEAGTFTVTVTSGKVTVTGPEGTTTDAPTTDTSGTTEN